MTATDDLLSRNAAHAPDARTGDAPKRPALRVAVVACMDARLDIFSMLGLAPGDAHVIRNAGGAITDDAIRSLAVSQRLLGTTEVMVVHHADCGMRGLDEDAFRGELETEAGTPPPWAPEPFGEAGADVRRALERVRSSPFLPHRDDVRGFVYDEQTGTLGEIS